MTEYKYVEITRKIIGASFEVHKYLGNGFQEVIYQRALEYEMKIAGLQFSRELEHKIFYKNLEKPIGKRRADFIVEEKVAVELKAVGIIENYHIAQTLSYLKAYKMEVGLLINFGAKSLEIRRLVRMLDSIN
jgi:GxxExxY protein